jgi:hypothetical protein
MMLKGIFILEASRLVQQFRRPRGGGLCRHENEVVHANFFEGGEEMVQIPRSCKHLRLHHIRDVYHYYMGGQEEPLAAVNVVQ